MGTVCRLPRGEAGFTVRKVGEDPRYLPNTIITPPNRDVLSYRLHVSSANWKIHPMSFLYSKNSAFESRFAEPHNILWIRILLVTWMNPDLDPKTYCNIFSYKKKQIGKTVYFCFYLLVLNASAKYIFFDFSIIDNLKLQFCFLESLVLWAGKKKMPPNPLFCIAVGGVCALLIKFFGFRCM